MLAVGMSTQIKKKRKRTTDSPLHTPPVVKKNKVLSDTSHSKKKKKNIPDAHVPELIVCADQLKNDLKPELKDELKNEVDKVLTKVEITDPTYNTTPVIKSEPISPVKKKKKAKIKVEIKEEVIEPEISQPVEQLVKKKKKKKTKVTEPVTESLSTVELATPKKVKKKKKKSEVVVPVIKDEPVEEPAEEATVELQAEDLLSGRCEEEKGGKVEIKDEKPSLSLFNSDIKQELLVEDHIDQQLVRSLSYAEDDPCIHHQTTDIHIALPPVYAGRIQEGIDMKMKQHSLKYMKELKGVLLKYTILSLQDPTGRYLSTRPEFHFNIKCNTTAFKPKIDESLTGTVVKMGPGYVNCLVYGYFTAVVYGRFQSVMEPGTLISFKLKHYQQTSSDDLVLKGVPEAARSS